ncbi:hypothetical protein PIB30_049373 [Stylosanthes scabra]|uniref:Uncharacterized protein n=1 Tax=Stylosanthes scabra TaxID=79078 RepID=A0ABU6UJ93_9FABA|nr:hypothetical protein [Stylosanthes scabra]
MEDVLAAETRIDLNYIATDGCDVSADVTGATASSQGHGYHLRMDKGPPDTLSPSPLQKWTRRGKDVVKQVTSKFVETLVSTTNKNMLTRPLGAGTFVVVVESPYPSQAMSERLENVSQGATKLKYRVQDSGRST